MAVAAEYKILYSQILTLADCVQIHSDMAVRIVGG